MPAASSARWAVMAAAHWCACREARWASLHSLPGDTKSTYPLPKLCHGASCCQVRIHGSSVNGGAGMPSGPGAAAFVFQARQSLASRNPRETSCIAVDFESRNKHRPPHSFRWPALFSCWLVFRWYTALSRLVSWSRSSRATRRTCMCTPALPCRRTFCRWSPRVCSCRRRCGP